MTRKTREPLKRSKEKESSAGEISPGDYRHILEGVELLAITLEECFGKVRRDRVRPSLSASVTGHITYKLPSENQAEVQNKYELVAGSESDEDFVLKITCEFSLIYSSKLPLTEDFMQEFTKRNVSLNTWPYFRELVQNMTQRMNVAPLVLPLLK
jgi:hypothetical protein